MNKIKFLFISFATLLLFISFQSGSSAISDLKVNIVDTVKIGNQVWMAHNADFPAYNSFWYNRDSIKFKSHGRLYFFSGAMAACPKGWHLPSDQEWQILIDYLGGDSLAVDKLIVGGSSKLNLTLSGYRSANSKDDLFGKMNEYGMYWTATVKTEQTAYGKMIVKGKKIEQQFYKRANAFSVRYIKD